MSSIHINQQPVVMAITDHVALPMQAKFETLVGELHEMLMQQSGFLSVDTIRHTRPRHVEYTFLLRFENEVLSTAWRLVPEISAKLEEIQDITGGNAQLVESVGLEFWVDHAGAGEPSIPPYWKRVMLGVAAVYPMLLFLIFLGQPLIGWMPQPFQVLCTVIALSALLTWPIMPQLSKLLHRWLFKGVT